MLDENKMQKTLLTVHELLVSKQYTKLEQWSGGNRLSASTIKEAMEEWPEAGKAYRFVMPPTSHIHDLVMDECLEAIPGIIPETWMIEAYLWTAEEGQSALSLRLTLSETPGEFYRVKIDDILVM